MRKIILVFSLLFVGTSFANVNLEAIKTDEFKKSNVLLNNVNEEVACTVRCSATATNTETGQSRTFYSSSTAELCGVASAMCQTKAISMAVEYIEEQMGQ